MRQTTLHRGVKERDKEHELDRTPHNEKTAIEGRFILKRIRDMIRTYCCLLHFTLLFITNATKDTIKFAYFF